LIRPVAGQARRAAATRAIPPPEGSSALPPRYYLGVFMTSKPTQEVRKPFNRLVYLLGGGLLIAIALAFAGTGGPGLFTLEEAMFGLGFALLVVAVVLAALSLTVASVISELRGLRAETNLLREAIRSDEKSHVLTIEGIGPKFASRLNADGIITISQLIQADAHRLAAAIDATPELVMEWQAMGRFMALSGIGPQYAEVIARCGYRGVEELAATTPAELLQRFHGIQDGKKVRIQKQELTEGTVRRWIEAARDASGQVQVAAPS